jgi:hypothetical protein
MSRRADLLVNDTENNLNRALRATGTNPSQYQAGRTAGEIGAGILMAAVASEAEISALARTGAARLAKRYAGEGFEQIANYAARKLTPGAAIGAAHDVLFDPVKEKDQGRYWGEKATQAAQGAVQGAAEPILKAKGRQLLGNARGLAKETYDNFMDDAGAPVASGVPERIVESPKLPTVTSPADTTDDRAQNRGAKRWRRSSLKSDTGASPSRGCCSGQSPARVRAIGSGESTMPPGLFGGWHYSNYPDYWDMA